MSSDFFLIPLEKQDNPNWEWRVATWPVSQVDPYVHDLFDGLRLDPVKYQRARYKDGKIENCEILKDGEDIIMKPGNGFNYLVKRVSFNNKSHTSIDQKEIPHDMKCDICMDSKKTHVLLDCNHVSLCELCSIHIYNTTKLCPICNTPMTKPPLKLIFS
jgi:hypothetical protein